MTTIKSAKVVQAQGAAALLTWSIKCHMAVSVSRPSIPICRAHPKSLRRLEPPAYSRYDLFNPFVDCPDGTTLTRLGPEGDGGKWLCMASNTFKEPCVAYSIGSNGDYGFEEAILKASQLCVACCATAQPKCPAFFVVVALI